MAAGSETANKRQGETMTGDSYGSNDIQFGATAIALAVQLAFVKNMNVRLEERDKRPRCWLGDG